MADRLRKTLRASGVSVQAMADELGVERNTVGNYLAGRTRPSHATLRVWAMATGAPLSWIKDGGDPAAMADERPAAPGGGQAFLPLGEGFGAPSGTRTPNPLIPSQSGRDVVVPFKRPAARTSTRQGTPDTLRPTVRTRHLTLVEAAS